MKPETSTSNSDNFAKKQSNISFKSEEFSFYPKEMECMSDDDMFKDAWLVADMQFPNLIDYFYLADVTDYGHDPDGYFGHRCRDFSSENEYDNYSKYRCYQGYSCFKYCKKESCEGCSLAPQKKVLNEQYILWEKYVQPID